MITINKTSITPSFDPSSMSSIDNFMQEARDRKLLTSEESKIFLQRMSETKTSAFIEKGKNERIEFCSDAVYQVLEELVKEYPTLLESVFDVRDANGQLVFAHFIDFLAFMSLPRFQWECYFNGNGGVLHVDIGKIKESLEDDLTSLKYLCNQVVSSDLLEYIIALRAYEAPLDNLQKLDMAKHPKEVAFYLHCRRFNWPSYQKALILVADPEADWNEAMTISPRILDFYRQLSNFHQLAYRIISKVGDIEKAFREMLLEGNDVKLLVIEGHGSDTGIQLSSTESINEESLSSIPFYLLPEGTPAILKACSTGKGENPIAQKIANAMQGVVYAPDANSTGHPTLEFKDTAVVGCKSNDPYFNIRRFSPSKK